MTNLEWGSMPLMAVMYVLSTGNVAPLSALSTNAEGTANKMISELSMTS